MKLTTAVTCILLGVAANAQMAPAQSKGQSSNPGVLLKLLHLPPGKVLGQMVTWRQSCDEVFGAALTMPGAQQVDNPTNGLSFHLDGSPAPAPYNLTVPFAGQETLVELSPRKPNAKDMKLARDSGRPLSKDQDLCEMDFPMASTGWDRASQQLDEKSLWEERAWVCKVGELVPGFVCPKWPGEKRVAGPESEFQKTSMKELERIAAEAGY